MSSIVRVQSNGGMVRFAKKSMLVHLQEVTVLVVEANLALSGWVCGHFMIFRVFRLALCLFDATRVL